jgi:hypothetical protein
VLTRPVRQQYCSKSSRRLRPKWTQPPIGCTIAETRAVLACCSRNVTLRTHPSFAKSAKDGAPQTYLLIVIKGGQPAVQLHIGK